jgi:hypothetical protein
MKNIYQSFLNIQQIHLAGDCICIVHPRVKIQHLSSVLQKRKYSNNSFWYYISALDIHTSHGKYKTRNKYCFDKIEEFNTYLLIKKSDDVFV